MSAEHEPKFCSPSPPMVMFPRVKNSKDGQLAKLKQFTINHKRLGTRVPPTVHNMPVKISDMVIFLHHDQEPVLLNNLRLRPKFQLTIKHFKINYSVRIR
jgi:hypothetical protein